MWLPQTCISTVFARAFPNRSLYSRKYLSRSRLVENTFTPIDASERAWDSIPISPHLSSRAWPRMKKFWFGFEKYRSSVSATVRMPCCFIFNARLAP